MRDVMMDIECIVVVCSVGIGWLVGMCVVVVEQQV